MQIGFGALLFISLLVLKLCGVIGWSWWVITFPLWGLPALLILIAALLFGSYMSWSSGGRINVHRTR